MLLKTLTNRLQKTPDKIAKYSHVYAVINGQRVYLETKTDANGEPYFVEAPVITTRNGISVHDEMMDVNSYRRCQIIGFPPDPERVWVVYNDVYYDKTLVKISHLKPINEARASEG